MDQKLVDAFYEAALYMKERVENDRWRWVSNLLREYARASHRLTFSNTVSPMVMDEVIRQHPELGEWITLNKHYKGHVPLAASEAKPNAHTPLHDDNTC